ncbi:hypothetical protein SLH46_11715 [Draconibacterium sp. IB214405]|uniref:hypothetical protein n=1 Tax=Draconibacterium sp. IB214405 TaxID=3097352 RepID=UPI002A16D255|nr:hypothetical protein [Draconibacterium sp. IB214405]MDX8339855.1 hypothetical protein [Draconibacterium sp. IB214405]
MNPLAIIGAFVITLSLLAYGIGSISLVRFRIIGRIVLLFLTLGVLLDLIAITLMTLGSKGSPFTLHGLLGAIAFIVMLVNAVWCWNVLLGKGIDTKAHKNHILYTKGAYLFWVIAYFTGSLIVIWR